MANNGYRNAYNGIYKPVNPDKWINNDKNLRYLSMWERSTFVYFDKNPNVLKVGAETKIINYVCQTDGKLHKYLIDLEVHYTDGRKVLIEIKPNKQVKVPKLAGKSITTQIDEAKVYKKNQSKWLYAQEYAEANGYIFEIWDEIKLRHERILI